MGAHLAVWLDTALDEAGRRDLDARVALYVAERLPGAVVDRAVGIYNQAIFTAVSLEDGLRDPFPGALRSGMLPGAAEVCLADLLAQLPVLTGKTPAVLTDEERAARAAARKVARDAGKARRGHDTLIRAAGRQAVQGAVVAPGFVQRDPISVAYGNGKAARVAARKRIFRERALADTIRIMEGRREADPRWSDGVPDGLRRRTMCAVAALLSWLVPVHALEGEIQRYGVHLVGRYWYDDVVTCRGLVSYIIDKARLAAHQATLGDDPAAYRDDRCKLALMRLLDPIEDEQPSRARRMTRRRAGPTSDTLPRRCSGCTRPLAGGPGGLEGVQPQRVSAEVASSPLRDAILIL